CGVPEGAHPRGPAVTRRWRASSAGAKLPAMRPNDPRRLASLTLVLALLPPLLAAQDSAAVRRGERVRLLLPGHVVDAWTLAGGGRGRAHRRARAHRPLVRRAARPGARRGPGRALALPRGTARAAPAPPDYAGSGPLPSRACRS